MNHFRKTLTFNIPSRRAFINITPQVEEALAESGFSEGLLLCNAMHITASVFINDDEPGLHHDYQRDAKHAVRGRTPRPKCAAIRNRVAFRRIGKTTFLPIRDVKVQDGLLHHAVMTYGWKNWHRMNP